ncbi:MAG: 3-isopropylmalate dehydratase small subunit [Chloroflexi bacterium]|nr:3-isopropylmalate dehydratase small subunit [Chloroflexota bacterium]
MPITGRAWVFGDKVDTDVILPGKYLVLSDEGELGKHALEGFDPGFVTKVQPGDIIVGGRYFGCGSSREQAPVALKGVGIAAVVAETFARIFYRNALNIGLPALECRARHLFQDGDPVSLNLETGEIRNLRTGQMAQAKPIPPFMMDIIAAGGLMNKIRVSLPKG